MFNEILFTYPEGKTNYQIINEYGKKTTITLEKWIADVLQNALNNVHEKIQAAYNKTIELRPNIGRIQRGDCVRQMAENTANKYQEVKKQILGWNDDEILDRL